MKIRFRRRKVLAVLLSICMFLGATNTNAYAKSNITDMDDNEEATIHSYGVEGAEIVSGSAIYVGGPDQSEHGDGSKAMPFSTLNKAAHSINTNGPGSYSIIMLGDTVETSPVVFGDGGVFDVSITVEAVTGGAITVSRGYDSGDMIDIAGNTTLTIEGCSESEPLIFDGKGDSYMGGYALIMVRADAALNVNANTYLKSNINTGTDIGYPGDGITNYGTVNVNGGTIAGFEYGIKSLGTLNISGGTISNNTYGIHNAGILNMSKNPSIPVGAGNSNGIYLSDKAINLLEDIILSDFNKILIVPDELKIGKQILTGKDNLLIESHKSFMLPDSNYDISETGAIEYIGDTPVHYVDAGYSGVDSDGSLEKPFLTLKAAVSAIDNGVKEGIIYICSDLEISEKININSDVTILNYGSEQHTIRSKYAYSILEVSDTGSLTLGVAGEGNDESPKLLITGISYQLISNTGIFRLYSGVKLYRNEEDGSGIGALYNSGTLSMYGGVISGYNRSNGAIENYGTFIMEGGRIRDCIGRNTGAIYSNIRGTFIMKGGRIEENSSDNGVAILCEGAIHLSGSASIPMKEDGSNKLMLSEKSDIYINSILETTENIVIATKRYLPGRQILQGDETVIRGSYHKFIIDPAVTDYCLAENGTLKYIGLSMDYYVDEKNGNDGNPGTKASPFATLKKAVDTIDSGVGTIHICSDLDLRERINVKGSIQLVNEGEPHVILRNPSYNGNMFYVTGQLELGNRELDRMSEVRLLTISGNNEKVSSTGVIIYNSDGRVILHNGVVLEDNTTGVGGAICNDESMKDGTIIMYGGVIQNNYVSLDGGGIFNDEGQGRITILGGSIRNNTAERNGGGICQWDGGLITISGGNIHDNTANSGGGIQALDGSINISGGKIYHNKAEQGGGLSLSRSYNSMSGGEIFGNTGLDENSKAIGRGINLNGSLLTISGNASISSDNEIALYDELIWYDKALVVVGGPLPEDMPVISLVKYDYEDVYPYDSYYFYPMGEQVIKPADGYTLTAQDISRFQMLDSNYGINHRGRIANSLSDSWFSLMDTDNIIYTGREIKPTVVGIAGTTSLLEGRDYQVRYKNNIHPGTASVYIYGMGNYGGTVIKSFTIKWAIYSGSSYTTPTPAPTLPPVPADTLLDSDTIRAARDAGKDIVISVKDEDGKVRYSWSFKGSYLAASDKEFEDLDLSLSIGEVEKNEDLAKLLGNTQTDTNDQSGLLITFKHQGDLPAQASIRIYVGNMGYEKGKKLYLYSFNSEAGKLDTLPYSSNYVVDKDGYITIKVVYCSDYVLLPRQAETGIITSLRNQISIETKKISLKLGAKNKKTAVIQVKLPKTLEQVKNLKDKTSGSAIGAVRITYKSDHSKIASVDSKGKITAKKAGKAVITVKTTLYSGKTKTFKVTVTVK